jgi:hypothetical protein
MIMAMPRAMSGAVSTLKLAQKSRMREMMKMTMPAPRMAPIGIAMGRITSRCTVVLRDRLSHCRGGWT